MTRARPGLARAFAQTTVDRGGRHVGPLGQREARLPEAIIRHARRIGRWRRCVTPGGVPSAWRPGATCVQRLDGSRDYRNSHQVSHFATFFIDARAEISVAESRFGCTFLNGKRRGQEIAPFRAARARLAFIVPWRWGAGFRLPGGLGRAFALPAV
ncbi:hypothetical protein K1719_047533 [Acacia pycnantha]|nr:hypothetical protein K1719_047533 [Acacia pycnantha]